MQFVYNNNSLNNDIITKIFSDNVIIPTDPRKNFRIIVVNNKLYFIKTINKNAAPTLITNPSQDKEMDPTCQVVTFLNDNKSYADFFVCINVISQHEKFDYYVMDYIKYGDFNNMLPVLNTKWKYSLLMQSLISIFILNHKIKLFHNDLCYINQIRNIMIDNVDKSYSMEINLNGTNIVLNVNKFAAKLIDFGRSSDKPAFRTTQYHTQYFSKIKYISEPLIFTLFFFKTMNNDELNNLLQIAFESSRNSTTTLQDFDSKFIIKIYNKYRKYIT